MRWFVIDRNEIEKVLADIFFARFTLDFIKNSEMKSLKLLGKTGIPARELLHIYFDVKREFGISIPEQDVAEGRFDTFAHIVDIIEEQLAS